MRLLVDISAAPSEKYEMAIVVLLDMEKAFNIVQIKFLEQQLKKKFYFLD